MSGTMWRRKECIIKIALLKPCGDTLDGISEELLHIKDLINTAGAYVVEVNTEISSYASKVNSLWHWGCKTCKERVEKADRYCKYCGTKLVLDSGSNMDEGGDDHDHKGSD